jgi:hypothetical protein
MTDAVKRGSLKWRLLIELAGRGQPVKLRDLCETLSLEPGATRQALTRLGLDELVTLKFHLRDSDRAAEDPGWWVITWQRQDALRRLDERPESASRRRHWWNRKPRPIDPDHAT